MIWERWRNRFVDGWHILWQDEWPKQSTNYTPEDLFSGSEVWTQPPAANTLPAKINIEPEKDALKDDFAFPGGVFSGSMSVFWGVFA